MARIDRLGEALCQFAMRVIPSPERYDKNGILRVITYPVTFAGVTDAAWTQIRKYGPTSASVTIRLLETIAVDAGHASRDDGGARDAPEFIDRHNGRSERGGQEPGEPMVVLGLAQVVDEPGSPRGP